MKDKKTELRIFTIADWKRKSAICKSDTSRLEI